MFRFLILLQDIVKLVYFTSLTIDIVERCEYNWMENWINMP